MCTILVAHRCAADAPLVLAANRDELVGRPSAPPAVLARAPLVAGGRDLLAGGTWLAVCADGRIAAVTNRRVDVRDPARRSRGELPLLTLAAGPSPGAARRFLASLEPGDYNPCNLLLADGEGVIVVHVDGGARVAHLGEGPHVLTTGDVDDAGSAKVLRLRAAFDDALRDAPAGAVLQERLEAILLDHGAEGAPATAACVHGDLYGTVSSSSVALTSAGGVRYRHAGGRPCVTPPADLSALLARGDALAPAATWASG